MILSEPTVIAAKVDNCCCQLRRAKRARWRWSVAAAPWGKSDPAGRNFKLFAICHTANCPRTHNSQWHVVCASSKCLYNTSWNGCHRNLARVYFFLSILYGLLVRLVLWPDLAHEFDGKVWGYNKYGDVYLVVLLPKSTIKANSRFEYAHDGELHFPPTWLTKPDEEKFRTRKHDNLRAIPVNGQPRKSNIQAIVYYRYVPEYIEEVIVYCMIVYCTNPW